MLPVFLNVYDVTKRDSVKILNAVLAHWWAPVKLGGVFHVAVEINGIEWSFGKTFLISRPGVFGVPPGKDPSHSFREKLFLGYTTLSMEQVSSILIDVIEEYQGRDYDTLRRNCCHFSEDLCQRLGVSKLPDWVYRLARIGAAAADFVNESMNDSWSERLQEMLPESLSSVWASWKTSSEESSSKPPVEGALPVDPGMAYPPL